MAHTVCGYVTNVPNQLYQRQLEWKWNAFLTGSIGYYLTKMCNHLRVDEYLIRQNIYRHVFFVFVTSATYKYGVYFHCIQLIL